MASFNYEEIFDDSRDPSRPQLEQLLAFAGAHAITLSSGESGISRILLPRRAQTAINSPIVHTGEDGATRVFRFAPPSS